MSVPTRPSAPAPAGFASPPSPSPKVSVVTPLYNSGACIAATLDSLLAQRYTNWETILVDDGSTDDTAAVVAPYLADPRFRYVRQENRGIAGARNTAIRMADGEWICFLDHDDRWLPEKLERQVGYTLAHGCDVTCTDAFVVRPAGRFVYSEAAFPDIVPELERMARRPDTDVLALLLRVNFICTCGVMLRRALFDRHGLLDPGCVPADDWDMWLRCAPSAKFGFLAEPLVEYHMHDRNFSRDVPRMFNAIFRVLRKHQRLHAGDALRQRQLHDALLAWYRLMRTALPREGRYLGLSRGLIGIAAGGPGGLATAYRICCAPLLARWWSILRSRLGPSTHV